MTYTGVISSEMDKEREKAELDDLKRLLKMKGDIKEFQIQETWNSLKSMQDELELPSLYPMKQHYYFYLRLEEIRNALAPFSSDFIQLNQLHVEINLLRGLLELPESSSISEVISLIRNKSLEELMALEFGSDSLLLKVILLQISKKPMTPTCDIKPALIHELDRNLLEILISYGPLTRPELVDVTGVARSSIYDSLRRLHFKGLIVQYSGKRTSVGRPMTLFDALI